MDKNLHLQGVKTAAALGAELKVPSHESRNGLVLARLVRFAQQGNRVILGMDQGGNSVVTRPGEAPVASFQGADCGGSAAVQRLQNLRLKHGIPVATKHYTYSDSKGSTHNVYTYVLDMQLFSMHPAAEYYLETAAA